MAPAEPEPRPDPLADLRDRLRATQEAAARLADDPPRVPPQGWAAPRAAGSGTADGGAPGGATGLGDDLQQLIAVVASLRELLPPELQQQLADLIRQVLLLLRAILDRWIDRLEPERGSEPDVEDIPIA